MVIICTCYDTHGQVNFTRLVVFLIPTTLCMKSIFRAKRQKYTGQQYLKMCDYFLILIMYYLSIIDVHIITSSKIVFHCHAEIEKIISLLLPYTDDRSKYRRLELVTSLPDFLPILYGASSENILSSVHVVVENYQWFTICDWDLKDSVETLRFQVLYRKKIKLKIHFDVSP